MVKNIFLLDSITDADKSFKSRIGISGSHGGLYPAALASAAGIRAVLFIDAGIGLDRAGVAGVLALDDVGMAASGIDCHSCHMGSASDALENGVISVPNNLAVSLGLKPGMPVKEAISLLEAAPEPEGILPEVAESRSEIMLEGSETSLLLVDSASLVTKEDAGKIIITGSHGGLIGGNPERALKAKARLAVFNDAGLAANLSGVTRLPALEERGVAAVTISHATARIGDARSALESGVISKANALAEATGAKPGLPLKNWLKTLTPLPVTG